MCPLPSHASTVWMIFVLIGRNGIVSASNNMHRRQWLSQCGAQLFEWWRYDGKDKWFCPARSLIMAVSWSWVIYVFILTWWQNFNSNMWGLGGDIVSDRGSIVIDFGYPSRAQCEFQGRNCENDRICRFLKTCMGICVGTLICWCKGESFPHKEQLVDDIAHDTMFIFCNEPVAIWVFPCQDCMRRSSGGDDALRGLLLHGCMGRFWKTWRNDEMIMFSWNLKSKSNYISSKEFPYTTHIWRFVFKDSSFLGWLLVRANVCCTGTQKGRVWFSVIWGVSLHRRCNRQWLS